MKFMSGINVSGEGKIDWSLGWFRSPDPIFIMDVYSTIALCRYWPNCLISPLWLCGGGVIILYELRL